MSPAVDEANVGALVAWLDSQLADDEAVARAADVKQGDPEWAVHEVVITGGEWFRVRSALDSRPIAHVQRLDGDNGEPAAILDAGAVASHIARWDPAAVLAVVQAMLDLLGEHCAYYGERPDTWFPVRVVSRLARAYRGRPGWRVEWDSLLVDL